MIREFNYVLTQLIPNSERAVVDIIKLQGYCLNLNHRVGRNKAILFESIFSLTIDDAEELREILLQVIKTHKARIGRKDKFGQRYILDFKLTWNNKSATIRTGWIITETDFGVPKLTTCYPLKNND